MPGSLLDELLQPFLSTLRTTDLKGWQTAFNLHFNELVEAKKVSSWEEIAKLINTKTDCKVTARTASTMFQRAKKKNMLNTESIINKDIDKKPQKDILNKKLTISDFPYAEVTDEIFNEYQKALPLIGIASIKQLIKHGIKISDVLSWKIVMTDIAATTTFITDKCFEVKQNWFNENRWK